ncbi:MAG: family 78 glycoside hydrolase catalytic domain [Planctomycetia bacterium]|nr:family 78 glycoside hydrolase catalytic domain [Planctomycetia bacterium]
MNFRVCFPRVGGVFMGLCISAFASHHVGAAPSARLGVPNIIARIPLPDRTEPVVPNRFTHASKNAPFRLRCDWTRNPLGIQQRYPRLTWMPPQRDTLPDQAQYQIQVATSPDDFRRGGTLIWNSGKVVEKPDFLPQYEGPVFKPFTHYYWRVRIWSRSGWKSQWSSMARWMTGPLTAGDWRGHWISYRPDISNPFYQLPHNAYYGLPHPKKIFHKSWIQKQPCPIFRRVFKAPDNLRHAYMYMAGLGYWKVLVNGHKVGPGVLYSTLYDYSKTVPFQTFDITKLLHKGRRNVITIALGNGWYNVMERDVWGWQNAIWRAWPRTRMNLLMRTTSGKVDWIVTNSTWQAAPGPRLADGVYNGEVYDAALKISGWNDPQKKLTNYPHAVVAKAPAGRLTGQLMSPCEVVQRLAPLSISEPEPHVFVVKFPQNMSGWVTLTAKGKVGVPVVLRYGERLFANGLVDQSSIDVFTYTGTFQTDTVIPANDKPFTYHPNFAYNGFQYVQVNGLPSKKDILGIQADFIHTAFHRAGEFWSANPLLNAIADAAGHSYCSNFMGYPTDCPTREKNGWTGDAWLAAVQGMMSYNNQLGYAKWLNDIENQQQPDGRLYLIFPNSRAWGKAGAPAWECAYEFVSWDQYVYGGDGEILREHYDGIKKYFLYTFAHQQGWVLGDWATCSRTPPPIAFTSTCILYHDAVLLSHIAAVLHRPRDAATFTMDAASIRKAFNAKYYKGHGVYSNGGQTAQAMPLYYGLVTVGRRASAVRRLVEDVHAHHDHLDVGILGDKCLFRVLSHYGHTALAYRIATQTTYPSYGQWILHGATTLWEAWGLHPSSMNHIMFGDILGWMYNDLAGIRPDWRSPGFRTIFIKPHPVKALHWVRAEHDCPYGLIQSAWRWHGNQLALNITIPPASSAFVTLAGAGREIVQCNGKPLTSGTEGILGIKREATNNGVLIVHVRSGHYQLVYHPDGVH